MRYALSEVVRYTGGEVHGDPSTEILGVASLENATETDLSFAKDDSLLDAARQSKAGALILPRRVEEIAKPQVVVDDPFLALTRFLAVVAATKTRQPEGVHPTAAIGEGTEIGEDVSVGANAGIGRDCRIGDRVTIHPCVSIGDRCRIGAETVIYANVSLREEVALGRRVIIHCGTTIGSDGFGYLQVDGRHAKIPQIGSVEIGDDVEIGANVTVDRGALDKTIIGRGVKIDNHCHIAHNVVIGEDSMLVAFAKISGSVRIGRRVIMAGDCSTVEKIEIGDGCILGARTGVSKSLKPGSVVWGAPSKPIDQEKKIQVALRHLPEIYEEFRRRHGRR